MANSGLVSGEPPENREAAHLNHRLNEQIELAGQMSVLRFWDELSPAQQAEFGRQLESIDWSIVSQRRNQCLNPDYSVKQAIGRIEPPRRIIRRPQTSAEISDWNDAREEGRQILHQGEVGVLLVAGGSGSRLGFDHPKGMYPIGPVTDRSLYHLFAEQVLALTRRQETPIPFLIMTSDSTHEETVAWFQQRHWFGLNSADVFFFQQGWESTLDANTGELLLAGKSALAVSPDGHGGLLNALLKANLFEELRRRKIKTLFYHQVDNPLVHVCDPAFLGFHARHDAQVSTKVVCKSSPEEKVGVVVEIDGRVEMIEYIDLPPDLASARDSDGQLSFRAGNTAIHLFQADFLEEVATCRGGLPWHQVRRSVPFVNSTGQIVHPSRPNGLKFERFIFDVLPIARTSLVVETDRKIEFAPLKNAEGDSSPVEVRRAMVEVAVDQLRAAGINIPDGISVEISPLALLPDEVPLLRSHISPPTDHAWILGPEDLAPCPESARKSGWAGTRLSIDSVGPLSFASKLMPRVWGGRGLGEVLGHTFPTDEPYGEAWDVSVLPDEVSRVSDGPFRGMPLTELWARYGQQLHGSNVAVPQQFPLLIKWLECRDWLSLQVHPDDVMARHVLKQPFGKSEAWIVLQADSTAKVMAGLRPGVSRDDFLRHLHAGTLEDCIHSFTPRSGDCIVLPAGTIHAAGGGLLIAEVQQSSDATFRLHDWNRLGLDGRPRQLQIDLALQAIDWTQGPIVPVTPCITRINSDGTREESLAEMHAFSLKRYAINRPWIASHTGELTLWMVLDGTAILTDSRTDGHREVPRGRTILIPATAGEVVWSPTQEGQSLTLLCIRMPQSMASET